LETAIITAINSLCEEEEPLEKLINLVYAYSKKGMNKQQLYDLFLQYHIDYQYTENWLSIAAKFSGDYPVDLLLDRICGWCSPDLALLPDESLEAK